MLSRSRLLAPVLLAGLALPMLLMPFRASEAVSRSENRRLAAAPKAPGSLQEAMTLPGRLEAYFEDHFAFRQEMIDVDAALRRAVTPPSGSLTEEVVVGRRGQLFLREGLHRSIGREIDRARVAEFVRFGCAASRRFRAQGAKVFVGLAPSPAHVIPDRLPAGLRPTGSATEHDLILEGLRACDVQTVDLRPTLRALRAQEEPYFKYDTHWTPAGALAAYNTLVSVGLGEASWRIPVERLTWVEAQLQDGDLLRIGRREPASETFRAPDVRSPGTLRLVDRADGLPATRVLDIKEAGPRILVLGDSFTQHQFAPLFATFAARVTWSHLAECRIDDHVLELARPTHVVVLPVDRNASCGTPGG